jgi:hypothetical protein
MGSADLAGRIDTVEHRMDLMELRWDESFAALSTQILQSNHETREAILAALRGDVAGEFSAMRAHFESALADSQNETRGYMRILYEDILSRIALLGEGRPSSS